MGKPIHKIESSFLYVKRNKWIWILKRRYSDVRVDTERLFRNSMTDKQKQILLFFFLSSKVVKGSHHQHCMGGGTQNPHENCQVSNIILIWATLTGGCLRLFLTLFSPGYQSFLFKYLLWAPTASSCVSLQTKRPTQHCDLLVVCPTLEVPAPK